MRKYLYVIIIWAIPQIANAQLYNQEKNVLVNFITRMYESEPFEGVKVVSDYDDEFLLSAVTLNTRKYANGSQANRVASVKAMSQATRYFNGSNVSTDIVIHTVEKSDGTSDTDVIEKIRENSRGYIEKMELLTTIQKDSSNVSYIFIKKIE